MVFDERPLIVIGVNNILIVPTPNKNEVNDAETETDSALSNHKKIEGQQTLD